MLTEKDFINTYQQYSEEELYQMTKNISGYSEEAQSALQKVIIARGGYDQLNESIAKKKVIADEIKRLQDETSKLGFGGVDEEFIKKTATSDILSKEQVQQIIDQQYRRVNTEMVDKKVDQQTIGRSVIGGIVSSLVCGIVFGIFLIITGAISPVIIVGLLLACFAIVKLIVKKSGNNSAVILTAFIAFIASFLIGYLMFQIIGPKL